MRFKAAETAAVRIATLRGRHSPGGCPVCKKVERDRRARFACPPQEKTRPAVAFHLKFNANQAYPV